MLKLRYTTLLLLILFQCSSLSQTTTIKIMTYNVKGDGPGTWDTRKPYLANVISAVNPDIIVAIEIANTKTDDFLNNVLGGTYSKGPFTANNDVISPNSNCLYYKTSKFNGGSVTNTIIPSYFDAGGSTQDRDINRFKITENGGGTIVIYAVHLRSSASVTQRAAQIQYLLDYISNNDPPTLSEDFIVLGDFNIDAPTEGAYKNIFVSQGGYFYDPSNPSEIFSGDWNQSDFWSYLSFRMDGVTKKFDNILISGNVKDNVNGIKYNSGSYTVHGNPGSYGDPTTDSDVLAASDHLPVYATFDFASVSPVELVSFTSVLNENHIDLSWRTETEINNYGFNIERSEKNLNWLTVGFVEGHGNSNSPKEYSFSDYDIELSGIYYYRLKQIDNDGTFEYSNIITVYANLPDNFSLSQNYPNPFNPETRIDFTISEIQQVSLKVYNALGEVVAELVNEQREPGSYSEIFDASDHPGGIYIYRLKTQKYTMNKKMALIK